LCKGFIVVGKEAVTRTVDIDEALALRKNVPVALSIRVICPLGPGFVSL
jgi:hypothetical protein